MSSDTGPELKRCPTLDIDEEFSECTQNIVYNKPSNRDYQLFSAMVKRNSAILKWNTVNDGESLENTQKGKRVRFGSDDTSNVVSEVCMYTRYLKDVYEEEDRKAREEAQRLEEEEKGLKLVFRPKSKTIVLPLPPQPLL